MGAENSVLEGCDWGDKLPCPDGFQWNVSPVSKSDGMEAVVFQAKNSDKKDNNLLQKATKTLKGLRHPNIVRFLGCGTSPDGFWLATEMVSPLMGVVNTVGLTSYELVSGVCDVLQALDFLHSKLGVCHNNICPNSIFVSKDGTWKLGGMEHTCKFLEATPELLESTRAFRNENSLAPEEKTGSVKVDVTTAHARDVFAVASVVNALLDLVTHKDGILGELEEQLIPCVSPEPSNRPSVTSLLASPAFRSDFVETVGFIKSITVKTDSEKKEFFGCLLAKLRCLPEEVVARRMVVPLLSRFVLLDDTAQRLVLPALLTPRSTQELPEKPSPPSSSSPSSPGLLSEALFRVHVIPHLCNVFRVHDLHIRLVLLTHFQHYAHLFSQTQLEEDIFLQILLGIRDTDDVLVASSLRALATLVPLLGGDYVIGGSRKAFFFHGMPKSVSSDQLQSPSSFSTLTLTPNVTGVMDTNHKQPLLKDLAAGLGPAAGRVSSQTSRTLSSEEKERKVREREQRREEARLKREERRMKAKDKQTNISNETTSPVRSQEEDVCDTRRSTSSPLPPPTTTTTITTTTILTIEEVGALEEEEQQRRKDGQLSPLTTHDVEKEDDGLYIHQGQGRDDLKAGEEVEEENETMAGDWSDWEDADTNGNLSDEIEDELKNMSDGGREGEGEEGGKLQTSPSPYEKEDTLGGSGHLDDTPSSRGRLDNKTSGSKDSKGPLALGRKSVAERESRVDANSSSSGRAKDITLGTSNNDTPLSDWVGTSDWNTPEHPVRNGGSLDYSQNNANASSTSSSSSGPKPLKLKSSSSSSTTTATTFSAVSSSSSSSSSSTISSNSKKPPPAKSKRWGDDDLGQGYDIKSIKVKSKSHAATMEDDLFADMAPVIVAAATSTPSDPVDDLLQMVRGGGGDEVKADSTTYSGSKVTGVKYKDDDEAWAKPVVVANSSLFAVATIVHGEAEGEEGEEGGGWGDDVDGWGTDDF